MNLGTLDCGCEFSEHTGSERQRVFEHHRLAGFFGRQISERDLGKATFFGSKAGPEGRVDDRGDRTRVGLRRESVFAHSPRFGEMAYEVLFN